jgi:hypothetical protein
MKSVKKEVEIVETEGLAALLGEKVFIMCLNYMYSGKLTGVNDSCILLEDAYLVYETGSWDKKTWADAQRLPADEWYINKAIIESFAKVNR